MTIDSYLEQVRPLSLTARACISLHVTEAYFRKKGLRHAIIDEFFNHLWQHPLKREPKEFSAWEAARGDLVDFGLTDDLPDDLDELLPLVDVTEEELFKVVEAPVEILWGNFFSTVDDKTAFDYLETSLRLAEKEGFIFPKISLYQTSLFADGNGWGKPIDMDTLVQWRKGGCIC